MALEFTDANFQSTVLDSDKVSVVDFWAPWCGPCRMVGPIIDKLADKYGDQAVIGKVNIDENQNTSVKYNVRSIPTVLFIKNGEVVDKHVGVAAPSVYQDKLEALMDVDADADAEV